MNIYIPGRSYLSLPIKWPVRTDIIPACLRANSSPEEEELSTCEAGNNSVNDWLMAELIVVGPGIELVFFVLRF